MKQFLTVVAFTLLTIGFFAGYSNFGIPQIEPAPPPKEEKLDLGSMTMDQFIALGDRIFQGKGTCTLCHNELGRAPMLASIAEDFAKRGDDPRYKGEAEDLEAYLVESLIEPSAFVVAGFGKKGTNDTESPMPDVSSGSIGLSEAEVAAVVAYLQDQAGAEVTVEIPTDVGEAEEEEEEEAREALSDPKAIMAQFTCDACHMINGEGGEVGPDLSKIGASKDRDYLRRSLLQPNADIAKGYEADMMPEDLGEQMFVSELEVLLDFLVELK
ncbi:MAG: c-type cytochrome [Alphaproteobacteria bacterium]|jgi:mono/diheme cytochrome c family protein/cytochrome c551/c552|nr:c-type cytochrome [Alphaproteobacteria bacterium]